MREDLPGRPCSVAAALNLVGERWALLAVREIIFGNKRFDAIARNTGAPRDRLAARLRALEEHGIITRHQYNEHPPRYEYELTEAGNDLRAVVSALRDWGDKWVMDSPPTVFDHACGHQLETAVSCRQCGAEVVPEEVTMRVVAPGWTREGPTAPAAGPSNVPVD
jgi:DNA-binding HxlR family transcriptional regulator